MPRPISITIIAALFILSGINSAWDIVYGMFHDRLNINLGVLTIPVGVGLIKGRSSSRWWAKFWIGLLFVVCLIVAGLFVLQVDMTPSFHGKKLLFPGAETLVILFFLTSGILGVCAWRALSSPKNAPFFDDFAEPDSPLTPPKVSAPQAPLP